jgi:phosphoglycolate phosphatase-like HAD superfamily hydrolase
MINTLISKYSLWREECLIVGDSWKDVAAGRNAGIKTVFLEGYYNKGTSTDFDFRITKIQEINSKQIFGG